MREQRLPLYFSSEVVLTLPVLTFLAIILSSALFGSVWGKTYFLLCLIGFLTLLNVSVILGLFVQAGTSPLRQILRSEAGPLLKICAAIAPYAAICAISPHPATQLSYLGLVVILINFALHFRLDQDFFAKLVVILFAATAIHLMLYPILGFPKYYNSLFAQKNVFALNVLIIFFGAYFVLKLTGSRDVKILAAATLSICVFLILLSRSRGVLLDIVFFLLIRGLWRYIAGNSKLYWLAFAACIAFVVLLVPLYVLLSYSTIGTELNAIVNQFTGVQLFSGRNILWPAYLYFISLKPLFGYGFGNEVGNMMVVAGLPSDLVGLSAHNLYLMVATQTGLIGLGALLFFFAIVWSILYHNRATQIGSISCACFLTGLFNETLEVTLIQTNMDVVVFFWFLVALGMRYDADAQLPLQRKPAWETGGPARQLPSF